MKTEKIISILEPVAKKAHELIQFQRFYVVLYDQDTNRLSFPVVRNGQDGDASIWPARELNAGILPDQVIVQGESTLVENQFPVWLQKWEISYWPDGEAAPQAWLGVPILTGKQNTIGALVIESWNEYALFTEEDRGLLETFARQTSNAFEKDRLWGELEEKISNLRILNKVGQQLMKGFAKQESEILDLIYSSATDLNLDTSNMYITFYDPDPNVPDTSQSIHGQLRFALAYDEGQKVKIPDRPARNGLTEYVIRTKESFNPVDVERVYQDIAQDQIGKIPRSWLGVPMIAEGRVFGVIVLRNNEFTEVYARNDQEILEILAAQAAISLLNLRYYEALERETAQRVMVERSAVMSSIGAELAHKMNNIAGTIPVRVNMARQELDAGNARDVKVLKQLDRIDAEAKVLLYTAQEIRESTEPTNVNLATPVDIHELLDTAAKQAIDSHINTEDEIEIARNYAPALPSVVVDRKALLVALTSIIKNGCEAIEGKGTVYLTTRLGGLEGKEVIEVEIRDTGKGIPPMDLPKIFDLFYTTKGDQGLGFGLWRDKMFIKNMGGDIDVLSEPNQGTLFTVRIPLKTGQNLIQR